MMIRPFDYGVGDALLVINKSRALRIRARRLIRDARRLYTPRHEMIYCILFANGVDQVVRRRRLRAIARAFRRRSNGISANGAVARRTLRRADRDLPA